MTHHQRTRTHERGQILVMVAMWIVPLFGLVGLAVDVGLMFIARAELRRDVDAAALAAIVELPNTTNVQLRATEYLLANDPEATLGPITYPATGQIQITATKQTELLFLPLVPGISAILINGKSISLSGSALAGAGAAMDIGMSIDDTGSMRDGCNGAQTNVGCPIKEARDGANTLINVVGIDGTSVTAGALIPSRGCFHDSGTGGCIDWLGSGNMIVNLTTTKATLQTGIAALRGNGGSGTNICTGVKETGARILTGPNARANARKVVVIMSDFDNNDANYPYSGSSPRPYPSPAYPTATCSSEGSAGTGADARINRIDLKTYQEAQAHKAAGVEIFVIGYSVVGTPSPATLCNVTNVGTGTGRTSGTSDLRDRNLAKCVASSTAGTNDHYFEAPTALDLQAAFTQIGKIISTRLIK